MSPRRGGRLSGLHQGAPRDLRRRFRQALGTVAGRSQLRAARPKGVKAWPPVRRQQRGHVLPLGLEALGRGAVLPAQLVAALGDAAAVGSRQRFLRRRCRGAASPACALLLLV